MRLSNPFALILVLIPLTILVLSVDWFGVRGINQNGLGFRIHLYSFGFTFALAALISILMFRRKHALTWQKACFNGAVAAGIWWLVTFGLLFYFHGFIGGRY